MSQAAEHEHLASGSLEIKKKLPTHPFFALSIIIGLAFIAAFIIPSGQYQREVINGITRQTVHFASQMGDGLSNILWPTNGALMAMLAVGGISWKNWFRFFGPLFAVIFVISLILVMVAQYIKLGPF